MTMELEHLHDAVCSIKKADAVRPRNDDNEYWKGYCDSAYETVETILNRIISELKVDI